MSAPTLARPADTTPPPCAWCSAPSDPELRDWCCTEHRSFDRSSETTWWRTSAGVR